MKKILALVIALPMWWASHAQVQVKKTTIQWDKQEYNFGRFMDNEGPKTIEFRFMNTGKAPMRLVNVVAACGCTTPSWSGDTVQPGKSGVIWARFDPKDRQGVFDKIITVQAWNTDPEFFVLTLKGEVIPHDMTPQERHPYPQGNLRFDMDHIPFGNVMNNTSDTVVIHVFNDGYATVNITGFQSADFMRWECKPLALRPKSEGTITGILDARRVNDYGLNFFTVAMTTDDKDQPSKLLQTSADIMQYFAPMSKKDSLNAPKASLDKITHDFGHIKQGEKVSTHFVLTNTGKNDLIIFKSKASCGCTASSMDKTTLKKGESTRIWVEYNSVGKNGRENKNVTLWTNDPWHPTIVLGIQSFVDPPGTPAPGK